MILGPEVLPDLWMARAGPNEDYVPKAGAITLSQEYINAATGRLRTVPDFEQRAAQVRYYMIQRKDIYGRLLPEAAQGLLSNLKAEQGH